MRTSEQLAERAKRLAALAFTARQEGQVELARALMRLAAESHEKATRSKTFESRDTGTGT